MIRVAGNTQAGAFYVIEVVKGFTCYVRDEEDSEILDFLAVKNDLKFSATSAEELLGLITMYKYLGGSWREYSDIKLTCEIFEREYIKVY